MSALLMIPAAGPVGKVKRKTQKHDNSLKTSSGTKSRGALDLESTKTKSSNSVASQTTSVVLHSPSHARAQWFNTQTLRYERVSESEERETFEHKLKELQAKVLSLQTPLNNILNRHNYNNEKLFTTKNVRYFQHIYFVEFQCNLTQDTETQLSFTQQKPTMERILAGPPQISSSDILRESCIRNIFRSASFWQEVKYDLSLEEKGTIYRDWLPRTASIQGFFVYTLDYILSNIGHLRCEDLNPIDYSQDQLFELQKQSFYYFSELQLPTLILLHKALHELFLLHHSVAPFSSHGKHKEHDFLETLTLTIINNLKINYHGMHKSDEAVELWHAFFLLVLKDILLPDPTLQANPAVSTEPSFEEIVPSDTSIVSLPPPSVFDSRQQLLVSGSTTNSSLKPKKKKFFRKIFKN